MEDGNTTDLSGYIDPGSFGGSDSIDWGSILGALGGQDLSGYTDPGMAGGGTDWVSQILRGGAMPATNTKSDALRSGTADQPFTGFGLGPSPSDASSSPSFLDTLAGLLSGSQGAKNLLGLLAGGVGPLASLTGQLASGGKGPATNTAGNSVTNKSESLTQNRTQTADARTMPQLLPQTADTYTQISQLLGSMQPQAQGLYGQGSGLLSSLLTPRSGTPASTLTPPSFIQGK